MTEEKKKRGAPTKKTPNRVQRIFKLAKEGKTNEEIAKMVEVSTETIRLWRQADFDFSCDLKEAQNEANQLVEAALFKRALGYDSTVQTQRIDKDGNVINVKETIHIPGHPTSQIYWTKNRDRKRWSDKVESEITGREGGPLVLEVIDYRGKKDE